MTVLVQCPGCKYVVCSTVVEGYRCDFRCPGCNKHPVSEFKPKKERKMPDDKKDMRYAPISETIKHRIISAKGKFFANDNISGFILDDLELLELQKEVEGKVHSLLESLVIDVDNDHNSHGTAKRVAKMFLNEIFAGRYHKEPRITSFPNAKHLDEMYTTGPITVRSSCSHHMLSVTGSCWIGVIPGEDVIGLSKFNRIVDWFASRGQIQEEMTVQIADYIEKLVKPKGLAVVIKATHGCMVCRGVKEPSSAAMTTSVMRGKLLENQAARAEFFQLAKVE